VADRFRPLWLGTKPDVVRSPSQALAVLLNGWPRKDGVMYRHAVNACRLAVSGQLPPDAARKAFVRVAIEEGLLK
jgi:ribosomal 50S subunit-associated protein YjgA (DUF615 family)